MKYGTICPLCGDLVELQHVTDPTKVIMIKGRRSVTKYYHTKCIEKENKQNGHNKS